VSRRTAPPPGATGVALVVLAVLAAAPAPAAEPPAPAAHQAGRQPADAPLEMEAFQLVLLMRPADRKDIPEAEVEAIQRQHLAHLQRMWAEGKMVVAGPFADQRDPAYRGACIYRVGTPEEARALAEADPAVQAGRLRVEVVTWWVGKGYLAFPRSPPAGG
jgi:uncharacterized protein YciI